MRAGDVRSGVLVINNDGGPCRRPATRSPARQPPAGSTAASPGGKQVGEHLRREQPDRCSPGSEHAPAGKTWPANRLSVQQLPLPKLILHTPRISGPADQRTTPRGSFRIPLVQPKVQEAPHLRATYRSMRSSAALNARARSVGAAIVRHAT